MELNPNKYIRAALVSALAAATGKPVFDEAVPPDVSPQPEEYVLVHCATKERFGVSKNHSEWACTSQIEVISIQEKGYFSSAAVDDIEEDILNRMNTVQVDGFTVKFTRLLDSRPQNVIGATETIVRRILIFEQWLGKSKTILVT